MTGQLDGQTAIITGASQGIGHATARLLAEQGASLALCARNGEKLTEVAADCEAAGVTVLTQVADVREADAMQTFVDSALERFGRIDVAVSNAGVARDGIFLRMPDEDWNEVLQTNLGGAFNFSRAVGRVLRKQKSGRLIFVASLSGVHGNANQANYAASKGGIIALAKSLAKEWLQYNVCVNCVLPGLIDTDMTRAYPERLREVGLQHIPMKRFGTPEEVAGAVLYLAGPHAAYITGKDIKVDGGIEI